MPSKKRKYNARFPAVSVEMKFGRFCMIFQAKPRFNKKLKVKTKQIEKCSIYFALFLIAGPHKKNNASR
jgi:hypothetical protein